MANCTTGDSQQPIRLTHSDSAGNQDDIDVQGHQEFPRQPLKRTQEVISMIGSASSVSIRLAVSLRGESSEKE